MTQRTHPTNGASPQQTRIWFPPLTGIRQIGTSRQGDGTTTYLYGVFMNKDMSPVKIVFTISPDLTLHVSANFDETLHQSLREGETA